MPGLKLGLGLNRFNPALLASFAQLVKSAGGVLYHDARKADGVGPLTGNDSPFVDLTKIGNDGTLTNFAGTGTSGWQATPNVLRFDGVDDFVAFADTASLDITNAPLAIGVTVKVTADTTSFVCAKNETNVADTEYSILHRTGRTVEWFYKNSAFCQFVANTSNYVNIVFYWDGVNITGYENNVQKNQQAFNGPLSTSGRFRLAAGLNGGVPSFLFDGDIATVTIYTGSDINKILNAEAKISAEYLALNP